MTINSVQNQGVADFSALRQARFKKADANQDGQLTRQELSAVVPKNGKGPGVEEIMAKVDTNQDGVIDDAEDQAALERMEKAGSGEGGRPQGPPPGGASPMGASDLATAIFGKADSDADGLITKTELASILGEGSEESSTVDADEVFKAADEDGDGTITQEELLAYFKKLEAERQPPPVESGGKAGYSRAGEPTRSETASCFEALA